MRKLSSSRFQDPRELSSPTHSSPIGLIHSIWGYTNKHHIEKKEIGYNTPVRLHCVCKQDTRERQDQKGSTKCNGRADGQWQSPRFPRLADFGGPSDLRALRNVLWEVPKVGCDRLLLLLLLLVGYCVEHHVLGSCIRSCNESWTRTCPYNSLNSHRFARNDEQV